jgi:hypothetical protein
MEIDSTKVLTLSGTVKPTLFVRQRQQALRYHLSVLTIEGLELLRRWEWR